jgi:hypothetical protein
MALTRGAPVAVAPRFIPLLRRLWPCNGLDPMRDKLRARRARPAAVACSISHVCEAMQRFFRRRPACRPPHGANATHLLPRQPCRPACRPPAACLGSTCPQDPCASGPVHLGRGAPRRRRLPPRLPCRRPRPSGRRRGTAHARCAPGGRCPMRCSRTWACPICELRPMKVAVSTWNRYFA